MSHRSRSRALRACITSRVRAPVLGLAVASLFATSNAFAWQPGKDGALTVGTSTAYTSLAAVRITTLSSAVTAGANSISIASATGISAGDVLMIYQAQGATINTASSVNFGDVTDYGNSGRYELVSVFAVTGTTITLNPACGTTPLRFSYDNGAQVIRVPQYSTLSVSAGATITAPLWNGSTGGVMPLIVQNGFTLSGQLSASSTGFRPGAIDNDTTAAGTDVAIWRSTASTAGGEKGEGIAGFQAAYDSNFNGRYGRGAPANGGGGGNAHNAGGGGGANGGVPGDWGDGFGNPSLTTAAWANAWNIDGSLTAATTSSGGGRGGYTYGASNLNALTDAPGNAGWTGNLRRERGGRGGRPLANNPSTAGTTRLFLGGGGGAGDANNGATTVGGRGGGFVLVIAGTLSGSGQIRADGQTAGNTASGHNDAPGGGGGGGTILVSAGTASGVALFASGGAGGNQNISGNESEGPGGGGGGGFIAAPAALATTVAGGANGTTTSGAVTEFVPNGATRGGAGIAQTVPALTSLPVCATEATVTLGVVKTNAVTTYTPGGTGTYTITVTNTGTVVATGAQVADTLPTGVTLTGPWTCTASAGGTCPANGGAVGGTAVTLTGNIAAGGTLTITVPVAYAATPSAY